MATKYMLMCCNKTIITDNAPKSCLTCGISPAEYVIVEDHENGYTVHRPPQSQKEPKKRKGG